MSLISAHRGGALVDGQTAAERYRRAIELGVDFVEFDVRKTKDCINIVSHDDKTVSGRPIREFAYREVSEELGSEALTFEEMLDLAAGRVGLHLDLKEGGYEAEIVTAALEKSPIDKLVITSGDEIIYTIKEQFPEVRVGLSLGDELAGAPVWVRVRVRLSEAFPDARIQRCHPDFVAVHQQLADFNVLRYCERHAMPVWIWTVDDQQAIERYLADKRVTTIITDRPELALRLRKDRS